MKTLWVLFIVGQLINAGNMNYQQEAGYYEINDRVYGRHPSKETVYMVKAVECIGIYGLTKAFPKYEEHLLVFANTVVWTTIYWDSQTQGIALNFRW